jgi:hypothetical protein
VLWPAGRLLEGQSGSDEDLGIHIGNPLNCSIEGRLLVADTVNSVRVVDSDGRAALDLHCTGGKVDALDCSRTGLQKVFSNLDKTGDCFAIYNISNHPVMMLSVLMSTVSLRDILTRLHGQ